LSTACSAGASQRRVISYQLNSSVYSSTLRLRKSVTPLLAQPAPVFSDLGTYILLSSFDFVSVADVTTAINRLPDKASEMDHMSTSVLKETSDFLSPFIAKLFNRSLIAGYFPDE
jgi:hypothetical protein